MATHSSVLAWRIPGTGEPGGLPSMGSHRVGHDWGDLAAAAAGSLCFWGSREGLGMDAAWKQRWSEAILKTHERWRSSGLVSKVQVSLGFISCKANNYSLEWKKQNVSVVWGGGGVREDILEGKRREKHFQVWVWHAHTAIFKRDNQQECTVKKKMI